MEETRAWGHPLDRKGGWIRIILGMILGGLLYLALRGVDFGKTWEVLRAMERAYLVLALAFVLVSSVVRAWRWRALFEEDVPGPVPPIGAIVTGQTLNFTIPFRSGEVARIFMVGGRKLRTAGKIAVEKALDASCFAGLCMMLPLIWPIPGWRERRTLRRSTPTWWATSTGESILPKAWLEEMFRTNLLSLAHP